MTGDPLASDGAHGPVAALGSQSVLLVGSYCVISFLRGQLINHDTQPAPAENQSNPIAPGTDPPKNKRRTLTILSVSVRQSTLELSKTHDNCVAQHGHFRPHDSPPGTTSESSEGMPEPINHPAHKTANHHRVTRFLPPRKMRKRGVQWNYGILTSMACRT